MEVIEAIVVQNANADGKESAASNSVGSDRIKAG